MRKDKINIVPYILPILTAIFLLFLIFSNFIGLGNAGITGFVINEPKIVGYVKINTIQKLDNCDFIINSYSGNDVIETVTLTSEQFLSRARLEHGALEEIYFLDLNTVDKISKDTDSDAIGVEVWCNGKNIAEGNSYL